MDLAEPGAQRGHRRPEEREAALVIAGAECVDRVAIARVRFRDSTPAGQTAERDRRGILVLVHLPEEATPAEVVRQRFVEVRAKEPVLARDERSREERLRAVDLAGRFGGCDLAQQLVEVHSPDGLRASSRRRPGSSRR